jgi:acyl dehydratase
MEIVYYEDIELHKRISIGEYYVDKEEMIEFSKKWDAKPFHIDEELAKSYPTGGLIAPLTYTLSIISRLGSISERAIIAFLAILEMERFQILNPVRPGDRLIVTEEHLDKRESRTRPDRGIVRILNEVKNQNGELCVSVVSVVLVSKRPA